MSLLEQLLSKMHGPRLAIRLFELEHRQPKSVAWQWIDWAADWRHGRAHWGSCATRLGRSVVVGAGADEVLAAEGPDSGAVDCAAATAARAASGAALAKRILGSSGKRIWALATGHEERRWRGWI